MNDLQKRIITVMDSINEPFISVSDIQQKGNIAKPVNVIEMNLRQIKRTGVVDVLPDKRWFLARPDAKKRFEKTLDKMCRTAPNRKKKKAGKRIPGSNPATIATKPEPPPNPPGTRKIPITIGELEDSVKQEKETGCVVLDAVQRLKVKLESQQETPNTVEDFQLKYDVLSELGEITESSITEVLHGIRDDLAYLRSLTEEPAPDASV